MMWYHEDMDKTDKAPSKPLEKQKEAAKPNGVELPHIQEVRKLDSAAQKMQEVKRKQEIAKWNKIQAWEK